MPLYGDVVSIAATSSGVSGTINVPEGSRLVGLNIADAGSGQTAVFSVASVEISWTSGPKNLKFVPKVFMQGATNGAALTMDKSPLIPLDIVVKGSNTITITVTTSANATLEVGLMWVAA